MEQPLGTPQQEANLCRLAFKGSKVGDPVQHCHHASWLEVLEEPAEKRIRYILDNKPFHEQAKRLRLFRPLAREAWEAREVWEAREAWKKAWEAREVWEAREAWKKVREAWEAREKAREAWKKVREVWEKTLNHSDYCKCPWSSDKDIFGHYR